MPESKAPKAKARPIVRLGMLLISHSLLVSVVCCTAGVVALLLLPILAKNTYISENALMPGSASSMLSSQDVSKANRLVKDLTSLNLKSAYTGIESQTLIAQYMSELGAEAGHHMFRPNFNQFHPLLLSAHSDSRIGRHNINCSSHGVNTVGIIRAPRGEGKEAIVLVTPYNSDKMSAGEALSVGIAYSILSLLSRVPWLAKDIIWLVADSRYGEHAPVSAWLRDYHAPEFSWQGPDAEMCFGSNGNLMKERTVPDDFRRAGIMAAGLVLKVADRTERFEDTLNIYAEATNGQMPNLDLINIANYLAVHRQGFRVKMQKLQSLLDSKWVKILGEMFESLGRVTKSLNMQWNFGIPTTDYVEGTATLASSLYYQALGVPTGPHGAFRDYQVDAITLEILPKFPFNNKVKHNDILLRGGRLIEGIIRSVNNLLEKFHQSFFLYLMTSPSKFVSVGVYMIAFALIVAPLPIVAASLYIDANRLSSGLEDKPTTFLTAVDDKLGITPRSLKWLNPAKTVLVVHLWGGFVSLLPLFISQIPNCTPTMSDILWALLSSLSFLILYLIFGCSSSHTNMFEHQEEWTLLKSVTISATFIGLSLMSVVNFATAEIGAFLIVPLCMMVQPLKLEIRASSLKTVMRATCNILLGFIGFPPVAYFVSKSIFEGFSSIEVGDFWNWFGSLLAWNSATYIYICMVHLPCWVLCMHILLHQC